MKLDAGWTRRALTLAMLLTLAAFPRAGGAQVAAGVPTGAEVDIEDAVWFAGPELLVVRGSFSEADLPVIFEGTDGIRLGRAQSDGPEDWRLEKRNLARVPCRVMAVASGQFDETEVRNAPADCGPVNDLEPSCAITPPAGPIELDQPVTFGGLATDPEGLPLTFAWHYGGGLDSTTVGETESGVPFDAVVSFEVDGQAFPVTLTVTDAEGQTGLCSVSVLVGDAPTLDRPPVPERPEPPGPRTSSHVLLGFNDLGMHCADLGSVPFSILPPFNVFNAQVFKRAQRPKRRRDGFVELRYSAASQPLDPVIADPATEPPSINSTSRNYPVGSQAGDAEIRKTDFWDLLDPNDPDGPTVVETLFGANPPPDEGLATIHNVDGIGRRMPGFGAPYIKNTTQPFSVYQPEFRWFKAEGTPITSVDDYGRLNSYPLMRLEAIRRMTGRTIASLDVVIPVSTEVDCRDCHTRGLVGADPDARADDLAFIPPEDPADRAAVEFAAKMNALLLHDFKHRFDDNGDLRYEPPLAERGAVLCAGCHNSFALEEVTGGVLAGDPTLDTMSGVAHGFHGKLKVFLSDGTLIRDPDGEPVLAIDLLPGEGRLFPVAPEDTTVRMEENCFKCHPGKITQCFRGAMFTAGLKCSSCHGDMLAMGGLFEGDFDHDGGARVRLPWRDEPRCESCHRGDAVRPGEGRMLSRLAYDLADPSAVPLLAGNRRFAEDRSADPDGGFDLTLYRNSLDGHGGPGRNSRVACEACHGSPHAIWGNSLPNANDNVTANQLQGHSGTLSDCFACHTEDSFPDGTLDGPHGMHPVNDPNWIDEDGHGEFAKDRSEGDRCAACHGKHHLGTRLSVSPVARQLRDRDGDLLATVAAGQEIRCNLCHSLEKSFDD